MWDGLSFRRNLLIVLVSLATLVIAAGALTAQGDLPAPEDRIINGVVERQIGSATTMEIQATYYSAPTGTASLAPGLLMLPQVSGFNANNSFMADRSALDGLARLFQASGFHVLTVNLDGYVWGGNAVDGLNDVQAAYDYLAIQPGVDVNRIAVFGASIGANYAMQLMEANPLITTAVLLSPAPDYGGVTSDPALLGDRTLITYYGTDEVGNPGLADYLDLFPSVITPTTGHGAALFVDPAAAQQAVDGWVSIMDAPPNQSTENPFGELINRMVEACNALFIAEGLGLVGFIRWGQRRRAARLRRETDTG